MRGNQNGGLIVWFPACDAVPGRTRPRGHQGATMAQRYAVPSRRSRPLALGAVALAAASTLALSAGPTAAATVGPLIKVSKSDPFAKCDPGNAGVPPGKNYPNGEVEPYVIADPSDPDHLLAGWQQDRWYNGGSRGLVAGVSTNGGKSWKVTVPHGVTKCAGGPYNRASDPWVAYSASGIAYFMHLFIQVRKNGDEAPNGMLVTRSTDGGLTWQKPVTLIKDNRPDVLDDKNSITADPNNPSVAYAVWDRLTGLLAQEEEGDGGKAPLAAHVYDGLPIAEQHRQAALAGKSSLQKQGAATPAAGQLPPKGPTWLSRTTNGGKTWSKAKIIYDPGLLFQTIGNQIVVTPTGTVVDFFSEINQANGGVRLGLVRSFDKGQTFEKKPHWIAPQSFTITGVITPTYGQPIRAPEELFDVAVDPQNGNLYAVWESSLFNTVDQIAFSMSRDGGLTWSDPVRINQTPQNGSVAKLRSQAFIPAIEVGPDGVVVVTYYDFRNDNDLNNGVEATDSWAVFCRAGVSDCTKAGSWQNEVRLTERSFNMLDAPEAGGHFVGDYTGLTRAGDAAVAVFGIADGQNKTSIYSRKIGIGSTPVVASTQ